MKRYLLYSSFIMVLILTGCQPAATITVKNNVKLRCTPVLTVRPGEDENSYSGLTRYETQRVFCTTGSSSVYSAILEKGSAEALNGNLFGAEIIFMELKDKETNGGVENNLAIIYELNGMNVKAFEMYTFALQLDPGSSLFRTNLYCFLSDRGLQPDIKSEKKRKKEDAQR